ncbi:MAG: hypothetical protein RR357_03370 [Clostridia bacterium]
MYKTFLKKNVLLQASIYICLLVAMVFLLYLFNYCYKICLTVINNNFAVEFVEQDNVVENVNKLNLKNYKAVRLVLSTNSEVQIKDSNVKIVSGRGLNAVNEVLTGNSGIEVGSKIIYNLKEFTVVGYIDSTAEYIFHKDFEFDKSEAVGAIIVAEPLKNYKKIVNEISNAFPNDNVHIPEKPSFFELMIDMPLIGGMLIYVLFSLTPLPIAVIYLIKKYEKVISVYRFLGYKPNDIIKRLALVYFVVMFSVFLISNLTYLLLERVWLNNFVSMFGTYFLKFKDYLIADLTFLIITCIFSMPIVNQIKTIKVDYNCD